MTRNRKKLGYLAALPVWAGLALGIACTPTAPQEPSAVTEERQPLLGKDGVVTYAGTAPINRYVAVTADAKVGDTSVKVTNVSTLNVAAGDLLMIIQMQGASIDTTDTAAYGTVTALNSAGLYEFANVVSVDAANNAIQVDTGIACGGTGAKGGLRNAYSMAGKVQVVRVPQYLSFTVPVGLTLSGQAWDGTTGGVLAFSALLATIEGTVDMTGAGFAGGNRQLTTNTAATTTFVSTTVIQGAAKGDSIAGSAIDYANNGGGFGRGAPANGGGGGDGHNGAGGGGANGDNGVAWTGIGNMNTTVDDPNSWKLDPEYIKGNAFTKSSGGGRGGYGCSNPAVAKDPTVVAPGDGMWACGNRTDAGGHGGHPVASDINTRLFLGGGGGAGDDDNNNGGSGGAGGGLIYIMGSLITSSGSGLIIANGIPGEAAGKRVLTGTSDAPGGGGGGGTVVLVASGAVTGVKVSATGGAGGDHSPGTGALLEGEGGGGGGGGGFVAVVAGTPPATVTGALAGKTTQLMFAKMPNNGGTDGGSGKSVMIAQYSTLTPKPICAPADIQVTITDNLKGAPPQSGGTVVYTVTIRNAGPNPAAGIKITDMLPAGLTGATWTCASATQTQCPMAAGTGSLASNRVTLAAGGSIVFTQTVPVPTTAMPNMAYTVAANPPADITDPNLTNNTATDTPSGSSSTGQQADLALTITRNPTSSQPGQEVTYTLQVTNNGPATAPTATVSFSVPPGATVTQPAQGTGWVCTNSGDTFTCTTLMLATGMAPPITVKLNTPQPGTPGAANPAVSGLVTAIGVTDPNPANNSASVDSAGITTTAADLAVTISKSPAAAMAGQEVTYTVQATDKGPGSVYNPIVTFTIPPGAIVTMEAAGQGWACQRNASAFTCLRSVIDQGDAPPIIAKIVTPVAGGSGGSGVVAATVSAPQNNDPNLANNTAVVDAGTVPPTGSDLAVTITQTPNTPTQGQVTYTLQATNKGPDPVNDVAVTLSVPPGSQVVQPAQGNGWTCVFDGSTFLCTTPTAPTGDLPPLTLVLTTSTSSTAGPVTGTVTAANNNDPVSANNVATAGGSSLFKLAGGGLGCSIAERSANPSPLLGLLAAATLLATATASRRRRTALRI